MRWGVVQTPAICHAYTKSSLPAAGDFHTDFARYLSRVTLNITMMSPVWEIEVLVEGFASQKMRF